MAEVITVIGLIASIASLALAVVAIWLAIVFYKLSLAESQASSQNAQQISTGISKLEKVFDGLYSDTFTIMKETVTDMRQFIWHREDGSTSSLAGSKGPNSVDAYSEPVLKKLEEFSAQLGIADEKVEALRKLLAPVVEESAEKVQDASSLKLQLLRCLTAEAQVGRTPTMVALGPLIAVAQGKAPKGPDNTRALYTSIASALFALRVEGKVTWRGDGDDLTLHTPIEVVRPETAEEPPVSSRAKKIANEESKRDGEVD